MMFCTSSSLHAVIDHRRPARRVHFKDLLDLTLHVLLAVRTSLVISAMDLPLNSGFGW